MNAQVTVAGDGKTITIHIPMTFRKRGGRKVVVTRDGAPWAPRPLVDNAMVKAIARAFRWRRMLDEGVHATLEDLAKRERIGKAYVSQLLRLTLLAPDIIEAILDGRQPAGLQLDDLLETFPFGWAEQCERLAIERGPWRAPQAQHEVVKSCLHPKIRLPDSPSGCIVTPGERPCNARRE